MQLSRALELLVLGLSAMSVAEATFIGARAVDRDGKGIQQRQDDEDSAKADPSTTAPPADKTTTTPPVDPSTTSEPPKVSSTTPPPPPTSSISTPPPVSSSSTPKPTPSSSSSDPASTEPPPETTSAEESAEPSTYIITQIITSTREDGQQVTFTSETLTTASAGLANGGGGGGSSGMSTQTRNTVIGVVVGVGGAIILGGLGLVAWRIWGRKKHHEENDGLMDYGSAIESKPETGGSMTGRTPFQSTLESYHAPTQVNTAANF